MTDGTDAPPCRGLVWAWHPDSSASLDENAVTALLRRHPDGGGLWLHLDLVDVRARSFLQNLLALPAFARDALLERGEGTHLEFRDGILFGAVPDFHQDVEGDPDPARTAPLHVALAPGLLVTGRRHPLRATHLVGTRPMPGASPAARWDAILRTLLDGVMRSATSLAAQVNGIEDALLRGDDSGRTRLSALRRSALLLHRQIEPLAHAYRELAEEAPDWLAPAGHSVAQMSRRLDGALRMTQGLQDRGRIAQDELASLAADEANRRLLVLSILTAVLLPPSLVAGIFGMNTTDLPGTTAPGGFWWALAAIIGSGVVALGLMLGLRVMGGGPSRRR
jgi:zinc transporter